jgi:hypothetical protein
MATFEFEHHAGILPDRAIVNVDGKYSVAIIRTDEGLVIDVLPMDWDNPVETFTVWDHDVATLENQDDWPFSEKEEL